MRLKNTHIIEKQTIEIRIPSEKKGSEWFEKIRVFNNDILQFKLEELFDRYADADTVTTISELQIDLGEIPTDAVLDESYADLVLHKLEEQLFALVKFTGYQSVGSAVEVKKERVSNAVFNSWLQYLETGILTGRAEAFSESDLSIYILEILQVDVDARKKLTAHFYTHPQSAIRLTRQMNQSFLEKLVACYETDAILTIKEYVAYFQNCIMNIQKQIGGNVSLLAYEQIWSVILKLLNVSNKSILAPLANRLVEILLVKLCESKNITESIAIAVKELGKHSFFKKAYSKFAKEVLGHSYLFISSNEGSIRILVSNLKELHGTYGKPSDSFFNNLFSSKMLEDRSGEHTDISSEDEADSSFRINHFSEEGAKKSSAGNDHTPKIVDSAKKDGAGAESEVANDKKATSNASALQDDKLEKSISSEPVEDVSDSVTIQTKRNKESSHEIDVHSTTDENEHFAYSEHAFEENTHHQDTIEEAKVKAEVKKLRWKNGDYIYVKYAGLVLLNPFFRNFFNKLNLLDQEGGFVESAQLKAVKLLQFMASGRTDLPEHEEVLAKFLCGVSFEDPISRHVELSEKELEEATNVLQVAIDYWGALGKATPDGLREGFLQRDGKLEKMENGWKLYVEQKTIDILLGKLPMGWGLGTIRLPWLEELLFVEWG